MNDQTLVLTPSGLMALLSQMEELKDYELELVDNDDSLQIKVGQNIYNLESPIGSVVQVSEEAVDVIEEIDDNGYDDIDDLEEADLEDISGDVVEGGIIKELIKTLAVGGLVRLTKDAIANS